ncbi:MAG: hypothetical protein PHQ32_00090 [Firmicutes bacterium]|nr:hypothetical protein [Bacillota bacterium]
MNSTLNFIKGNSKLAKILIYYFVIPNLIFFCSDFIYDDINSWLYSLFLILLLAIIIVFALIGIIRINKLYSFRENGLVKRYFKSWAYTIISIILFTAWFFTLVILLAFLVGIFTMNLYIDIDTVADKCMDLLMYYYLLLFILGIPLIQIITTNYIYMKESIIVSFFSIFKLNVGNYIKLITLMALYFFAMVIIYEISTLVTIITILVSSLVYFIYLIELSKFFLEQWNSVVLIKENNKLSFSVE